jgi:GR25 family glycosyltransferase involved in LPS biosynthesis
MDESVMTKLDLFNNTHVISLAHRLDRRSVIAKQFELYQIPYSFFDAINGHELDYNGPLLKGEEGVRLSHIELLNKSIKNNEKSLFIFEDDVEFSESFNEDLHRALNVVPDNFDMLYLGASHHLKPELVKDNLYKISHSYTAHALCIKSNLFAPLRDTISNNKNLPVDVIYALVQPQVNAFAIYPHLAWQFNSYSDIQNKFVDYEFLKKEFVRFENQTIL